MGLTWEPKNDKQTMYFVSVIKTRHMSVSRDNVKITPKEMSKFLSYDHLIRWNVEKRAFNSIKKKMTGFDKYEEYWTSIALL